MKSWRSSVRHLWSIGPKATHIQTPRPSSIHAVMGRISMFRSPLIATLIGALIFAPAAEACTGIRLVAKDGGVIAARSLEFGFDLHSDVMVVPAGTALTGTLPDGGKGISYKTK